MSAVSDKLENSFIDWFFRGQALGLNGASAAAGTGPTHLFVGLLAASPTPSDSAVGTELTGAGYGRVDIPSTLANWAGTQGAGTTVASTGSSGTTSNNVAVQFGAPTANWGVATHFALFDALTGGNRLYYGALTTPKTINNGDAAPSFAAGALTIQVDN